MQSNVKVFFPYQNTGTIKYRGMGKTSGLLQLSLSMRMFIGTAFEIKNKAESNK